VRVRGKRSPDINERRCKQLSERRSRLELQLPLNALCVVALLHVACSPISIPRRLSGKLPSAAHQNNSVFRFVNEIAEKLHEGIYFLFPDATRRMLRLACRDCEQALAPSLSLSLSLSRARARAFSRNLRQETRRVNASERDIRSIFSYVRLTAPDAPGRGITEAAMAGPEESTS